jgi:hypothetical protein
MYSIFDHSGQQIVILTTIWSWQVREILTVNKQRLQRSHMERFDLKKLNEVEGKEKYRIEVSNRFAALEDLDTGGN